jgi:hypothetical protein
MVSDAWLDWFTQRQVVPSIAVTRSDEFVEAMAPAFSA